MSLTPEQVTAKNFKTFYEGILPYLNKPVASGFTPVGAVIAIMGNSAPANYLACDGQIVNIADYPELASYFNVQFGSSNYFGGNGTTTFGIPDLRGEFLRGTGTNSHTNQGNGAAVGVHQNGTEFPYLYSGKGTTSDKPYVGFKIRGNLDSTEYNAILNMDKSIARYSSATYGTVTATLEGTSTAPTDCCTSRPTNTSVLYCIATKNIFMDPGNNYSTDEQVIGTWIDGKPLYQKTLINNNATSGATSLQMGKIQNADTLFISEGFYVNAQSDMAEVGATINVNVSGRGQSVSNLRYASYAVAGKTYGIQVFYGDSTKSSKTIITVKYTKTTD